MCVCVCMYTHACMHVCIHICACMQACMHAHTHIPLLSPQSASIPLLSPIPRLIPSHRPPSLPLRSPSLSNHLHIPLSPSHPSPIISNDPQANKSASLKRSENPKQSASSKQFRNSRIHEFMNLVISEFSPLIRFFSLFFEKVGVWDARTDSERCPNRSENV